MSDDEPFDFNQKRTKKVKKPKTTKEQKATEEGVEKAVVDTFVDPNKYEDMLNRVFTIMKEGKINSNESKKLLFPPIALETLGLKKNKKYLWRNFVDFATQVNRPTDHLRDYFATQLSIDPILSNEGTLKFEGRRLEMEELKNIFTKYIHEYVKCPMCMSLKTSMIKDSNLRVYVISCEICKAQRALEHIKSSKK